MPAQRCGAYFSRNSEMSRIIITGLVSSLAAGVGGCSSTQIAHRWESRRIANQASVQIPPDATLGQFDLQFYMARAKETNAPLEWVDQANAQSAWLRVQRAEAEGARVKASADRASALAEADQLMAEAAALHQIAGFEAERQRTAQNVRFNQLREEINAQRALSDITERSGQIEIASVMLDLQGQVSQMKAEADSAWAAAHVENQRLLAEQERVGQQGSAIIEQMNEQVHLLQERAEHHAWSLEAQAQATRRRAEAEAQLFAQQSRSELQTGTDRQRELLERAEFVVSQAAADAQRFNAEADAIEASNVEGTYRAAIAQADQNRQQAMIEAQNLRESAMQRLNAYTAEFTRARQEAEYEFNSAQEAHQNGLTALEAEERQAGASFAIATSKAQEIEFDARETFIRAEMLSDTTGRSISEIRADAEQAADELAAAYRDIAASDPAAIEILSETEHGDAFVSALATVDRMRADAQAAFDRSSEDIAARRMQIERDFEEAHATWRNSKSEVAAAEHRATSEVRQMFAQADAVLAQADRDYEQACTDAESARDQALARAVELRAKAEAVVADAEAQAERFRAESETALAAAQAIADEYEAKRQAVLAAGEAQVRQYLAQAELVRSESSRRIADLQERIAASQDLLDAEVARLASVAEQQLEMARLEHEEAMLLADTYSRIGAARVAALAAQNALNSQDRANALALSERNLEAEQSLVAERIDSELARADAAYEAFETEDALRRARASALEQIMLAYVEQQHATAGAQESTIMARFNARLAELQAERDRAYARAYVDAQRAEAEKIAGGVPMPPPLSDATLARLEAAAVNIRNAAAEARNILQASRAQLDAQAQIDATDVTDSPGGEVATVPTDVD